MPNHHVFKKSTFCAGTKIFNNLSHSLIILKNDKAKLKATLKKYWNTQFFSSEDEFPVQESGYLAAFKSNYSLTFLQLLMVKS
jgi:hypothetical protein